MLQNHTESRRERVRRNQYHLQDEAVATAAAIQNRKAKQQQQPQQKKLRAETNNNVTRNNNKLHKVENVSQSASRKK